MKILCLVHSPDKLIGSILFPVEDLGGKVNQFFELSAVSTKLVVSDSLLIGGQQKKVHQIMMFTKSWVERYYIEPLRSFESCQRPALYSPPSRQRSNNSSCSIL